MRHTHPLHCTVFMAAWFAAPRNAALQYSLRYCVYIRWTSYTAVFPSLPLCTQSSSSVYNSTVNTHHHHYGLATTQTLTGQASIYYCSENKHYRKRCRDQFFRFTAYFFGVSLSLLAIFKTAQDKPFTVATCANNRSQQFNFLAEAVEIASPSVVYIEKSQYVSTIFGEAVGVSSGSGFIVHDGRYVLTNAHVVANSRSVKVKLSTGTVVKGEVTDIDQVSDLALIKLDLPEAEKLPAVKFGSSSSLRPGEWVVALGSPLNLTNTITAGIVSSVLRPSRELGLGEHKPDMEYVQTDAPITRGNSGGPLVNLDGEVIGVNTMTAGPGISFAIPSDFAQHFVSNAVKTVKKHTKTVKYALGISMLSINPRILRLILQKTSLPRDVTHGVFLANVWPDSAAARAGLHRGDIVVKINGADMHSSGDVNAVVQSGKRLEMEIVRKGKWVIVSAVPEPLYSEG